MPTWDFEDEDEDRFAEDEDEKGRQILCNVGVDSGSKSAKLELRETGVNNERSVLPVQSSFH